MLFHFSQVVQQKMGVRGMVMIARHPIWPVCVVLVPPGVWCLLIVISFVFRAAGGHDSNMAEIELDRGLDNVAHKIILEFGTVVARDFYAEKKKNSVENFLFPGGVHWRLTMAGTQAWFS